MVKFLKHNVILATLIGVSLINLFAGLLSIPLMAIGNFDFLIGLVLLVLASILIVGSGHLFTGWRLSFKRKTDLEAENAPKHPAPRQVASVKNQPIKVNRYARFCLYVGGFMIVLGIVLTSV